ncbi:MAG: HAMP domain-containing sensor histidine kinase [Chitinophagaceae bacterium]
MNLAALKKHALFYVIVAGFLIMVVILLSLVTTAFKGKEKDFNDKLFYVVWFYEGHLNQDSSLFRFPLNDEAYIHFAQTRIKHDVDSVFLKNDIPLDYVFAVGKLKIKQGTLPLYSLPIRTWTGPDLIWSSDTANNEGLIITKLKIANFNQPNYNQYFVKIFFPFKQSYLYKELLPLIVITILTMLVLFICFLALLTTIKRQNKLSQIRNDFINNMTHELKTPLFTISIASRMLAEQPPTQSDKKQASYVNSIQAETKRLMHLVDKVLQSASLQYIAESDKEITDMHIQVQQAIRQLELIAQEKNAVIELHLDALQHYVSAVPMYIQGMLTSLIDNAFKYSEGAPHITISTKNSNNALEVTVADKGIGLSNETKKLIFDRFFRANTGNLHNVKGYGIGLSYVKSIVEAHNGSIKVNSQPGKGSQFIIILPFIKHDNQP